MDIIIKLYLDPEMDLDEELVKTVVEALTRSVFSEANEIAFKKLTRPIEDDVSVVVIRSALDGDTKHQLELALKTIFTQHFEISISDTSSMLLRKAAIDETVAWFTERLSKIEALRHKAYLQYLTKIAELRTESEQRFLSQ